MRRLAVFQAGVLLTLAIAAGSLQAAPQRSNEELRIHFGFGGSQHSPDLEEKAYNDRLYGSLLAGGVGFNTDWQETYGGGVDFLLEYLRGPWRFSFFNEGAGSRPKYLGFSAVQSSSLSFTQLESVEVDSLGRLNTRAEAGYDLLRGSESNQLFLVFGIAAMAQRAEYNRLTVNTASAGGLSASAIGLGLSDYTQESAVGPALGLDYRYQATETLELQAALRLLAMGGDWEMERISLFSNGAVDLRTESGDLSAAGFNLLLGLHWAFAENWLLDYTISVTSLQIGDENVTPIALNSSTSFDASRYLLDYALTYPGSSHNDTISVVSLGVSYRLSLSEE
ncbi:MAG: hypothetical protein K1X75_01275 [Leptospirales bacterium]|nr:hypothetical protein [Leptospirales bacterium]